MRYCKVWSCLMLVLVLESQKFPTSTAFHNGESSKSDGKYSRFYDMDPSRFRRDNRLVNQTTKSEDSCCTVFPTICNTYGDCVLDINICVQLCVCATAADGYWCTQVIKLLTSGASTIATTTTLPSTLPPTAIPKLYASFVETDDDSNHTDSSSETSLSHSTTLDPRGTTLEILQFPSVSPLVPPPVISSPSNPLRLNNSVTTHISGNETQGTSITTIASSIKNVISRLVKSESILKNLTRVRNNCNNCYDGKCILGKDYQPRCARNIDMGAENTTCPLGFDCKNGFCVIESGKSGVSCECFKNWTGHFCNEPCLLNCGDHGKCVKHETEVCACYWNYTGVNCETHDPSMNLMKGATTIKVTNTPWSVIGICFGLLVVLLMLLILIPYYLYRKQWIPMRKLVYYFQHYEDDDGKEYDAFISYKSSKSDEQFVVQKLYPKLEKELDFKLCLHFRDFLPGEAIANSIIQAIQNSRRTIMILTPNYIESEWCRLEYQTAQHEMLKLKHKIIPIILEDIDHVKSVDSNLKSIIDTVTYIKWPLGEISKEEEKFWKLLELTMPKKKLDCSSSTSRTSSEVPLSGVTPLPSSDTLSDDVFTSSVSVEIEPDDNAMVEVTPLDENPHIISCLEHSGDCQILPNEHGLLSDYPAV
ncbi:hypothetical protein LOTGIDRAFT_166958 [Lottia gigantea]|uniref:TIR domain-containing protein n=1 Tax=Lottia gigantea TaxID=225164 RepID=V3ZVQ1_LOTGI|nr:hypothetical protein LOTGIDRAFT_166958 [Lottia gigantea]ESO86685.1 hypothetical protein LOTGIDRAFT_166958 [Lottia gigantea]